MIFTEIIRKRMGTINKYPVIQNPGILHDLFANRAKAIH
jgi:hypothetical protein